MWPVAGGGDRVCYSESRLIIPSHVSHESVTTPSLRPPLPEQVPGLHRPYSQSEGQGLHTVRESSHPGTYAYKKTALDA